jgi:hypothetical protein
MHRDRLDAHLVRRAMDAQRNLAAIGNQDSLDGHGSANKDEGLIEFDRLGVVD